jgi:hypothetical protein
MEIMTQAAGEIATEAAEATTAVLAQQVTINQATEATIVATAQQVVLHKAVEATIAAPVQQVALHKAAAQLPMDVNLPIEF